MAGPGNGQRRDAENLGAGIRLILEELRDLRVEMRADRRRSDDERRRADEDRKRAEAEWRRERQVSDRRLERVIRASTQRDAATRRIGLVIARTLDQHTRILERIDRKLGAWGNGPPRSGNGGKSN